MTTIRSFNEVITYADDIIDIYKEKYDTILTKVVVTNFNVYFYFVNKNSQEETLIFEQILKYLDLLVKSEKVANVGKKNSFQCKKCEKWFLIMYFDEEGNIKLPAGGVFYTKCPHCNEINGIKYLLHISNV